MAPLSACERVGHAAAEDKVVHLVHEVFDDANLRAHLRSAHDGREGALDVGKDVVDSRHFLLHQQAQHLVVGVKVVGDDGRAGMAAMGCAEGVHHVAVGVGGQCLGKFLLAFLHFLLGGVVFGRTFLYANGLAFLLGIESEVFQQQNVAWLQGCGSILCLCAVRCELDGRAECSGNGIRDLSEGEFGVHFSFGLAHVAHDDEGSSVGKYLFQGGQGATYARVVRDFSVFVKGYVEVNADDDFLTLEVAFVDGHDCIVCFRVRTFRRKSKGKNSNGKENVVANAKTAMVIASFFATGLADMWHFGLICVKFSPVHIPPYNKNM